MVKPAEARKAELADKLAKAAQQGTAADIAGAIIDAIDQSLSDRRNRPGRRDRDNDGNGGTNRD
jgi:hypothetical protein